MAVRDDIGKGSEWAWKGYNEDQNTKKRKCYADSGNG